MTALTAISQKWNAVVLNQSFPTIQVEKQKNKLD
jgi:hypothetical protein